jgi:hypothetical protein
VLLAGRFDDPGNAALVGSDLGSPSFADDQTVANNVALYAFGLAARGVVTIHSNGYVAGGTDPLLLAVHGFGRRRQLHRLELRAGLFQRR